MQALLHSHLSDFQQVATNGAPRPRKLFRGRRQCECLDYLGLSSGKHALRCDLLAELLQEPQADRQGQHAAVIAPFYTTVCIFCRMCRQIDGYILELITADCTYIHTYIHTFIHTFIHSYIHTFIHSYIHTFIHSYIHTFIHSYIHTFTHSYIHTFIHSYIHMYVSKNINTHIYIYVSQTRSPHVYFTLGYLLLFWFTPLIPPYKVVLVKVAGVHSPIDGDAHPPG